MDYIRYINILKYFKWLITIYPVSKMGDPCINPWYIRSTSYPPRDKAHHGPPSRLSLTNKRRTTISSTGILANLSPSADLARTQSKAIANSTSLSTSHPPRDKAHDGPPSRLSLPI